MMKTVLLSYCERNKLVRIPNDKPESDLVYLQNEFKKLFSYKGNVSLTISFQRYHKEWDTTLELDEEDTIMDKDTLKVVVMPCIVTPDPSTSTYEVEVSDALVGGGSLVSLLLLFRHTNFCTSM